MRSSHSDEHFFSSRSFNSLGITTKIGYILDHLGLEFPSRIQALSYKPILSGKTCILGEQTGSGKTLAYLLPTLQRMMDSGVETNRNDEKNKLMSPHIVVFAPTTELSNQIYELFKKISSILRFRSACVNGESDMNAEMRKFRLGADLVVATPGRFLLLVDKMMKRYKKENNELSPIFNETLSVVFDEVDSLFLDSTFPLPEIGSENISLSLNFFHCHVSLNGGVFLGSLFGPQSQYLFVTATLPDTVSQQIQLEFPNISLIQGPGMHRVPLTMSVDVIDCGEYSKTNKMGYYRAARRGINPSSIIEDRNRPKPELALSGNDALDYKLSKLKGLLHDIPNGQRIVLFCNSLDQCQQLTQHWPHYGPNTTLVLPYHGGIESDIRLRNMKMFCNHDIKDSMCLISSDRSSKGLDFEAIEVDHVILFDFPRDLCEFLRRIGRTARAGHEGRVTILAIGKQNMYCQALLQSIRSGKKLDPIIENMARSDDLQNL